MKDHIYKIVFLTDLNSSTATILKSTAGLAKMIGASIDVFSVVKPTDIVAVENQLSCLRAINQAHLKLEGKMKEFTEPISKEFGIDIRYSFTFGNIKNELEDYIIATKPDLIVLGKRKPSTFRFIGDSITQFVLNIFDGVVMIAADENAMEPGKEFSIGVMNDLESFMGTKFADSLLKHSKTPISLFKIVKKANSPNQVGNAVNEATIDYVFEENDKAINSISNSLLKNNINLLCFERDSNNISKVAGQRSMNIKAMLNSINVSLLIGSH